MKITDKELLEWIRISGVCVFSDPDGYYTVSDSETQPKERFLNMIRAAIRAEKRGKNK